MTNIMPRHMGITKKHMTQYHWVKGQPKKEEYEEREWVKALLDIAPRDTVREILTYLYTKDFPYEVPITLLSETGIRRK